MDVADPKQRSQRNRRRQRAARMHKQAAAAQEQRGTGSAEEGDDESPTRQKPHRPPTRKKRIKEKNEPIAEEDIIDGFSILSFRTYEDLEMNIGGTLSFGVVKTLFEPKMETGQWKDSPRVGLTPCDHRPNSVIEKNLKIVENNNRVTPEPLLMNNSVTSTSTLCNQNNPNRLSPNTRTPSANNHIGSAAVVVAQQNRVNQTVSPCNPLISPAATARYRPSATVSSKPKIMTNQPAPGVKVPVATRAVKTESKRPESPSPATTGQAISSDPPSQGSSSYSSQSAATPTTPLAASTVVKSEQREETKTGNVASVVSTTGGQLPTARSLSPNPAQVDRLVNRNHVLVRHPVNKILPNARDESSEDVKCAVVFPGQAKEEVVAQAVSRAEENAQSPARPPPTLEEESGRGGVNAICNGTRAQPRPPANTNATTGAGHLSDVSSRSSSGRGYMCDSESDDERGSDADGSSDIFNTPGAPIVSIKRESESCPRLNETSPTTTTTAENPRPLAPGTPLLATPPTTPPPLGPPLVLSVDKSPVHPQPPVLLENRPKLEPVSTGHSLASSRLAKSGPRSRWSGVGSESPVREVSPHVTVVLTPTTTTTTATTVSNSTASPSLCAIDSPRDKHSLATVLGNAIAPVTLSSSSDSNSSISAVTTKTTTHQIFSPAASIINEKRQMSPGPMGPLSFLGGVRDSYTGSRKENKSEISIPSSFTNISSSATIPPVNSLHSVTPPILPYSGGHLVSSIQPSQLHQSRSDRTPILPFHSVANHLTGYPMTNSKKQTMATVGSSPANGPLATLPPPPAPLYSPLSPHPYPRPTSSSPLLGLQSSVPPKTGYVTLPVPLALSSSPILPNLVPVSNVISSSVITHASTSVSSSTTTARTDTSPSVLATGSGTPVPASTTPTPSVCSGRDSHSAHSSSSISSLSQLSQSLGHSSTGHKENGREGGSSGSSSSGRSRSSSRNNTPCVSSASSAPPPPLSALSSSVSSSAIVPNCASIQCSSSYPSSTYSAGLTSLVFSKPSWVSTSANPILSSLNGTHLTPPLPSRPTPPPANPAPPPSLPLPPSLHNSHHSSPYGPHLPGGPPPPPPTLHPGGPGSAHPSIFAPPIPPPPSSLASLGPSPTGAPFSADSLFSQPNTDLLRRELDTRFLASQDRSIAIPPPPYMRTEMHQHQHTHMHQHGPFLPPPPPSLSASSSSMPSVVQPPAPGPTPPSSHMPFDKFPKLPDSSFFGRNSLGLPGYPPMGPILGPPGASSGTPFAPAGHHAAFQPKLNPLVKNKNVKSGRWCAMHVRIAWEIYHHQQKQQSDGHKPGNSSMSSVPGKSPTDLLRPPGGGPTVPSGAPPPHSLFPSLTGRSPHDISALSSSLLAASAGNHARPFEPHHNSFLTPSGAHLSVSPYGRPGTFPTFGPPPGTGFGGLGSLGLTGASLFGGRDPRCLPGPLSSVGGPPGAVEPLYGSLHHRTPPSGPFPPSSSSNSSVGGPTGSGSGGASWGGLKAEAERERERMQREEQEREREREREQQRIREEKQREQREKEQQRMREEKQRQEKEQMEKERERREQERQKERDRENRLNYQHQQQQQQQQQQQHQQQQHQQHQQQQHHHNGDIMMDRLRDPRDHHRDHWEAAHRSSRERERKERSSLNRSSSNSSAFDNNSLASGGNTSHHDHRGSQGKPEVKVKEEKKDDEPHHQPPQHHHTPNHTHERMIHESTPPGSEYLRSLQQQRASPASISAAMNLSHPLDRVRLMRSLPPLGPVESQSPHTQVPPHFWGPLGPVQTAGAQTANGNDLRDTLRSLEYHHHQQQQQQARDMREREFLQRYASLGSVVGPPHHHPSHDRFREAEFARHLVAAGDLDRQLHLERQFDRSKLGPPPLRTNDLPPTFPSALSSVFPPMSMVPRLGGLAPHPGPSLGLPLRSSKNGSPSSSTGIPPPLIPCTGGSGPAPNQGVSPPMLNHKLGLSTPGSLLENDSYYNAKDRREMALHPEIDSQSR